ncbi:MAG: ribosome-associated translation inhibitor RaiA [Actinomycetota bacterium]
MDIVVKGRKADVSEKFRQHTVDKLSKVERLNHRIIRIDVEVSEERNPRLTSTKDRVELTCLSKGPIIRAEAAAADAYAALDLALDKLEGRLRRAADKRRVHYGQHSPDSLRQGTTAIAAGDEAFAELAADETDEPQIVVREKAFESEPMHLDDALHHMELVGHDFFLFADADSGLASVVYRRKGYAYGVIRLKQ